MGIRDRKLWKTGVTAAICLALIALFSCLKTNETVAEFLTRTWDRAWVTVAGGISALFPFSLFELGCYIFAVCAVIAIGKGIYFWRKGRVKEGFLPLCRVFSALMCVLAVYASTASVGYCRAPLQGVERASFAQEKSLRIADAWMTELNRLAEVQEREVDGSLSRRSVREISEIMEKECAVLTDKYFHPYTYRAKPMVSSFAMSLSGIIGVTFQPTGEVNLNRYAAALDGPYLFAHETAHAKGVMRENDADTVALYVTLCSENAYVRYSGLLNAYGDLRQIYALYGEGKNAPMPSETVLRDLRDRNDHYAQYHTFIEKIGNFFNDIYLKLSGMQDGTGSYTQQGSSTLTPDGSGNLVYRVEFSDMQKVLLARGERLI